MNKKLIALAVAGALTAPMAAQAEATVYGKIHVSVENIDNDCSAPADTQFVTYTCADSSSMGVSSNSSRLGFKGSEDLGGGLTAVWQMENSVSVTEGSTFANTRNSFLGLAGGFGTVLAGRHDTPYKMLGRKVEMFGDTIGDYRTISNNSGHEARTPNTIAYVSPNMSGLTAILAYVTDVAGDGSDNNDNDAYSMSLAYDNGPLMVGVAHQAISSDAFGGTDDATATRVAGSYTMGSLKLALNYMQEQANWGGADNDRDIWGIGAAYKMGNNTLKAQYYTMDELDSAADTEADKWALGVYHAMSKKTSVYAVYSQVNNGDAQGLIVDGSGHGDSGLAPTVTRTPVIGASTTQGSVGNSPSAFAVGMIHKF